MLIQKHRMPQIVATREGPSAVARETAACEEEEEEEEEKDHRRRQGTAHKSQQRCVQTEYSPGRPRGIPVPHQEVSATTPRQRAGLHWLEMGHPSGVWRERKGARMTAILEPRLLCQRISHSGQKTCRSSGEERPKKTRTEEMPHETVRSRPVKHEDEESHTSVMA